MNKSCLITGASRGIGKAIAFAMAKEGYNLHLVCQNNISLLEEIKDELTIKYPISVDIYQCNIGNYAEVKSTFSKITHLDVLINNAGISHIGLLTDMEESEWHNIISVNLDALFFTCKEICPLMIRNHSGRIINISSVWGNVGASMEVAYSTTKGGVNSFTKALAKELAPSNIAVNAIACGFVNTEMNNHLTKEEINSIVEDIPADRICSPEEIGQAVAKLVSMPEYLTGQIITIDGGWI